MSKTIRVRPASRSEIDNSCVLSAGPAPRTTGPARIIAVESYANPSMCTAQEGKARSRGQLCHRCPRRRARDHSKVVVRCLVPRLSGPTGTGARGVRWQPDVDGIHVDPGESRRGDADNGVGPRVDEERRPEHVFVRLVAAPPERVAQDGDGRGRLDATLVAGEEPPTLGIERPPTRSTRR